jgi:hypothetical protein
MEEQMIKELFSKLKNRIKNPPMHKCHWKDPLCIAKPRLLGCICGKGETTIQAAPTTPAPSAGESAAQIAEAKLKYDPMTAASDFAIQQQYAPQQAALYQSLYNQYMPQMAAAQQTTQQQLYPIQSGIMESGAQDIASRLANPNYMTAGEQQAQTASRDKSVSNLQKAMRERANLGGGLYGGRAAGAETQSVSDLLNQFQMQDYTNRMQAAAQTQSDLTKYLQILYPQVGTQQPNTSAYQYTSAVPSADTLYNAIYGASQPQYFSSGGDTGAGAWGLGGSALGALGTLGAGMMISSKRYKTNIKLWA